MTTTGLSNMRDQIWRGLFPTALLLALLGFQCGPQKGTAPIRIDQTKPIAVTAGQEPLRRFDERVEALLETLSIEEKVGQLNQRPGGHGISPNSLLSDAEEDLIRQGKVGAYLHVVGAETTHGLQCIAMEESKQKIPLLFGLDVVHGYRTIFPVPLAGAASWNADGVERATRMAAEEATAAGIHWTFAPMVDIARDPRWGRVVEGAGEDPFLGAVMAAAQVKGFQGEDLRASDTFLACVKHYIGYGAAEGGRDYNSVNLSYPEIYDVYMPPFLAAVQAGVGSVMTGFNDLSGIPMTMNHDMIASLFDAGFNGFVVSDWNAVYELLNHGVAESRSDAVVKAANAGVHMDMRSELYTEFLPEAVRAGRVSVAQLDEAVGRVLQAKVDLGLFDDPYRYGDAEKDKPGPLPTDHVAAARELAAESMVLLKNDGRLLPLDKDTRMLAVIGPIADDPLTPLGSWKAMGRTEDTVTFLAGIKAAVSPKTSVLFEQGCDAIDEDHHQIEKAVKVAKRADAVILCVGETGDMSGESRSRSTIDLPGVQRELAAAIMATGKPVVVVLVSGRPLTIPWMVDRAPAILAAWLPGVQAGPALADILFGDVSPSGKLPITFPRTVGQIPIYYAHRHTGRPPDEDLSKHTSRYQDLPISPLYAFGHGLSYTAFEYRHLKVEKQTVRGVSVFQVAVDVTNTGKRDGVEIVQVYVRDEVASTARPIKQLVGFKRIAIRAGETARVAIDVPEKQLGFFTAKNRYEVEPGRFEVMVGSASDDIRLKDTLTVDE